MRVPSFERFRRLSAVAAYFVCGMVVGAAVWSGMASEQYNQVVLDNIELTQQIEKYKEDIDRMQGNSDKENIIQSIEVFIEEPPNEQPLDAVTEKELKKRVKLDLDGFRGRKIYSIGQDAQFARPMLQNKIYSGIGDQDYTVKINTVLVADGVLTVWVEAEVYLRP